MEWLELASVDDWPSSEGHRRDIARELSAALGDGWEAHDERRCDLAFPGVVYRPLELVMLAIPGGVFTMGQRDDEDAPLERAVCGDEHDAYYRREVAPLAADRKPAHQVTMGPFLCGRDHLQFDDVTLVLRPCEENRMGRSLTSARAQLVVAQLHARGLRLPSEAEWEWIARAGDDRNSWIGDFSAARTGLALEGTMSNDRWGTLYLVNSDGGEWVADSWHDSYVGAPSDGRAWEPDVNGQPGVARGALLFGWQQRYEAVTLHAAYRTSGVFPSRVLRAARDLPARR